MWQCSWQAQLHFFHDTTDDLWVFNFAGTHSYLPANVVHHSASIKTYIYLIKTRIYTCMSASYTQWCLPGMTSGLRTTQSTTHNQGPHYLQHTQEHFQPPPISTVKHYRLGSFRKVKVFLLLKCSTSHCVSCISHPDLALLKISDCLPQPAQVYAASQLLAIWNSMFWA